MCTPFAPNNEKNSATEMDCHVALAEFTSSCLLADNTSCYAALDV